MAKAFSGQAIIRALVKGEADPSVLAGMAKGRMRKKQGELARALVGKLSNHHRFMLSDLLDQLDFLDQQIAKTEVRIEEQLAQMPLFQPAVILLDTLPGVDRQLAIVIVAEIGIDMSRFPSDRHITAWAGVAPGNNETGGKQRSGKARKGNRYLRRALVLAAWGAVRSKRNYLRSQYYRLAARRGKPRAAMAVGRTILQAAYHLLLRGEPYQELGADYLDQLDRERTAKRLLKRLDSLGYDISTVKDRLATLPATEEPTLPRQPLPIPA